jgi:hypothetical protein
MRTSKLILLLVGLLIGLFCILPDILRALCLP